MRIYLGILFMAFCFSADLIAQETPVDSTATSPPTSQARKFESLFFDGIQEKAIENYDKAITIFKKCKAINPEEGIVYVELAKSYAALENYAMAERSFVEALSRLPDNRKKPIKKNLYELYKTLQQPEKALEIAQQLKGDPYYQLEIVKIYQLLNQYEKALKELEKLQQKDPFYTEFRKYRYEIYKESNQPNQAIAFYEKQIDQENDVVWNACKLIAFLMQDEQREKALQTAHQLDAKKTGNSQAWHCLANFYIDADKKDKATEYVKKILTNKYINETVKFKILEKYRKYASQYPELERKLINMLNDALQIEKSSASNLENARYYEDKNPQKALKFYRLALEDQPNNFKLLKKVSLLELDFDNFEKAKKVAQQGKSLFPGQAIFYYVAGKAAVATKNYESGIADLDEALMYLYDNAALKKKIKQSLAKAYQATGNEKQANELLEEAKKISE